MKEIAEAEVLSPLAPRQKKQLREMMSALLDSTGNQREYLISMLLTQAVPEGGEEPSLKTMRILTAALLEQLISILRNGKELTESSHFDFFKYLGYFPVDQTNQFTQALLLASSEDSYLTEEDSRLFSRLELLYLLTKLGDFDAARPLLAELESQVSLANPRLYLVYQLALGRSLQQRGKRLQFTSLYLNLVSDFYQQDGSESALYIVLRWIGMLNWGRETVLKKFLLLKYGPTIRKSGNLLSATLLYELFSMETKLVSPTEKMHYARMLFKHPVTLFSVQQMQLLHFFAGNYYSGMKLSFQESIRYFQHSNYYLHKSWAYLRSLSEFLRENLLPEQFTQTMIHMERWVIELGSQISLQNNAYVETLLANYAITRDLYKQVEELSITDKLTGLKNRRYLANNLSHMFQLAARHKVSICFAMLDIDLFKKVNDTHGHVAGDLVLKDLARLLTKTYRKSDVIVRYGGEEFLLIFFDIHKERFMSMMEDLRHRVEKHHFGRKETHISITISIGATCDCEPCLTEEQLEQRIEKADAALYIAKNGGRNKVVSTEC